MLAKVKPLLRARIRRRVFKRNYINDLPFELLAKIFLFCLPITFPRPSRREAPLLLGRVCRVWRSVSLHTPQLWAQIILEYFFLSNPKHTLNYETFHRFGIHE
ncbi:hypothetical protein BD410DRAFT_735089 [Rickenella mellea]|uniref:Uncharacterized protein n=1 Tax=Rickenella mellea TaxID=50990 RepID=A0A4Y7PF25_9AGAM|nr:hypothetical protein BD410DRAFT_735089 [Rickenella mellea]